jgi:hypothetical protein
MWNLRLRYHLLRHLEKFPSICAWHVIWSMEYRTYFLRGGMDLTPICTTPCMPYDLCMVRLMATCTSCFTNRWSWRVREHSEKFPKVFERHLIFVNIILRKEEGSYPNILDNGSQDLGHLKISKYVWFLKVI